MKILTLLILVACVLAICSAQAQSRGGFGPNQPPNLMNLMLFRSMMDMNMLPAMYLSGHFGAGGGMGSMLAPMMFAGAF